MNTEFLWPFLLVSCTLCRWSKVKASQTPARADSIKLLFIVFVCREPVNSAGKVLLFNSSPAGGADGRDFHLAEGHLVSVFFYQFSVKCYKSCVYFCIHLICANLKTFRSSKFSSNSIKFVQLFTNKQKFIKTRQIRKNFHMVYYGHTLIMLEIRIMNA